MNYYNEHDPKAAAWLRELIKRGHIPDGVVDERSIEDVVPSELTGFAQCHFFAGIGGWSLALQLAGWPEDRPVWTGSCPCQPFSTAGKGSGFADERHLWPAFHHLISQCQPPVVFGEQVASKDGLAWLDLVHADCEASGYAFGASDLCAAGIGAPHIRQRLWWVAHSISERRRERQSGSQDADHATGSGKAGRMDNGLKPGLEGQWVRHCPEVGRDGEVRPVAEAGESCRVADANSAGPQQGRAPATSTGHWDSAVADGCNRWASPLHGLWRDADWLFCRDGKWRPVEPGTSPLAHGLPARVVRLRGYGNAIVPQIGAEFIKATGLITQHP